MFGKTTAPVLVGLIGFLLALVFGLSVLIDSDWDPTAFAAFGAEAEPTLTYAESRLGEVRVRPGQGHDGKYFFVQANDPWVLDPDENALTLDHPVYRSQRMLYPAVAGLGGLASPELIVWGLLITNVLGIGIGSWVVALVGLEMGASPWWGLSFALNLGTLSELTIDGGGILAMLFSFLALLMLMRERFGLSVGSLVLAGLSREVMLIAAAGVALWLWRKSRLRQAVLAFVLPTLAVGTWALYLRLRIDPTPTEGRVEALGAPFQGIARAFGNWSDDPVNMAVGLSMILLVLLFTWRAVVDKQLVGWAFLGFVPLGLVLTEQVWTSWFDISRALMPILPAYLLILFAPSSLNAIVVKT